MRVEQVPQFWTLVLGIPLTECISERENSLFGSGAFFVAARTPDRGVEFVLLQGGKQCFSLQVPATSRNAQFQRVGSSCNGFFVAVHDQPRTDRSCKSVAELEHLFELVAGIDVQQRERKRRRMKSLPGEVNEDAGVFTDGVQDHRIAKFRGHLSQYEDRFVFEGVQMASMCFDNH